MYVRTVCRCCYQCVSQLENVWCNTWKTRTRLHNYICRNSCTHCTAHTHHTTLNHRWNYIQGLALATVTVQAHWPLPPCPLPWLKGEGSAVPAEGIGWAVHLQPGLLWRGLPLGGPPAKGGYWRTTWLPSRIGTCRIGDGGRMGSLAVCGGESTQQNRSAWWIYRIQRGAFVAVSLINLSDTLLSYWIIVSKEEKNMKKRKWKISKFCHFISAHFCMPSRSFYSVAVPHSPLHKPCFCDFQCIFEFLSYQYQCISTTKQIVLPLHRECYHTPWYTVSTLYDWDVWLTVWSIRVYICLHPDTSASWSWLPYTLTVEPYLGV